jgi:hypothetical protein
MELMQIAVYDTHVTKKDRQIVHFEVMVPDGTPQESVLEFAKTFLSNVGQGGQKCGADECKFCHIEHARANVEQSIRKSRYYIFEMEGCREA